MNITHNRLPIWLNTFAEQEDFTQQAAADGDPWVLFWGHGEEKVVIGTFRSAEAAQMIRRLDAELSGRENYYTIRSVEAGGMSL